MRKIYGGDVVADTVSAGDLLTDRQSVEEQTVTEEVLHLFQGATEERAIPIGSDDCAFEGIFDGAGYTLSGLVIEEDGNSKYYGLFRKIGSDGVVRNLTLSDSDIGYNKYGGVVYVGGIVDFRKIENDEKYLIYLCKSVMFVSYQIYSSALIREHGV